jgi:hypothetical protein
MLDDLIGDFVLLGGKLLELFFRILDLVAAGTGADAKRKVATVIIERQRARRPS